MAGKIIDEDVLKLTVQNLTQLIADHVFEEEEYTPEEVDNMFDGTTQEISYYSSLINDNLVSENRLYSSKKIADEIAKAIIDSNAYADGLITNLSSIELKYVDSLPSAGNSNTIYILKSTTSDPDTLNLYNDGAWTVIGDFNINLDSYAKVDYVNTKLGEKANKTEVLLQDDVLTTTGSETNDNVYSAKLTKTELDKKANDSDLTVHTGDTDIHTSATEKASYVKKTDIVTTIGKTSTDDTVPSASAIYNKSKNKIADLPNGTDIIAYADSISNETVADTVRIMNAPNSPYKAVGIGSDFYYTIYNIADDGYKRIVAYDIRKNDMYMIMKHSGTWGTWRKVCATSVKDVPKTQINYNTSDIKSGEISYEVINGICYVYINGIIPARVGTNIEINQTLMPKPREEIVTCSVIHDATNERIGLFFMASANSNPRVHFYSTDKKGYGLFSYPVAES